MGMESKITASLVEFDEAAMSEHISMQLNDGRKPKGILGDLQDGMEIVGARFADGEYFLAELIMSAEIFSNAMKILDPLMANDAPTLKGKIVFATVQGDLHDLGKNIVISMLRSSGFDVYDLGVDVPPQNIIDKVKETGSTIVGLTALLTTAFPSMKKTVDALAEAGIRDQVKVMIGGAPTNDDVKGLVGADARGKDAHQAVEIARKLMETS